MDKEVVKELIQDDLTVENLTIELKKILTDPETRATLKKDYTALRNLLSLGGNASANAPKVSIIISRPKGEWAMVNCE